MIIWSKALHLGNLQKQGARKQYLYRLITSDAITSQVYAGESEAIQAIFLMLVLNISVR